MDDSDPTYVTTFQEDDTGKIEQGISIFLLYLNLEYFVVSEISKRINEGKKK